MCDECAEIELTIERFRSIKHGVSDELTLQRAQAVIADLEGRKATLHDRLTERPPTTGRY